MNLNKKVVLITGSSIGIGQATALTFAKEKSTIIITYYSHKKPALETAEKCRKLGAETAVLKLDVLSTASMKNVVNTIVKKYKKIDILVNNAAVIRWKPLTKQTFKEIELQIRTNLEGLIKMTQITLPYVKEMIINVASGAGKEAYPQITTYCATKFGVRGFTQALAKETKLKVYAVNPDMTKTRMTDFQGRPPEEVANIIVNTAKGKYNVKSGGDIDVWEITHKVYEP